MELKSPLHRVPSLLPRYSLYAGRIVDRPQTPECELDADAKVIVLLYDSGENEDEGTGTGTSADKEDTAVNRSA